MDKKSKILINGKFAPYYYTDLLDWFARNGVSYKNHRETLPHHSKNLIHYLWPMSIQYQSSLNPIFLCESPSFAQLNQCPAWLIRDGLVPLLWFFHLNPKPIGFKTRFFIHQSLEAFVPAPWRSKVGTYQIRSNHKPQSHKPSNILFVGNLFPDSTSPDTTLHILDTFIQKFGKNHLKFSNKFAYFSSKTNRFRQDTEHFFAPDFYLKIYKKIGTDIEILNWAQFESQVYARNALIVNINDDFLCADSFLIHHALAGGAHLFQADPPMRNARSDSHSSILPLSENHHFLIHERIPARSNVTRRVTKRQSDQLMKMLKRIDLTMRSSTNHHFPWPDWFSNWTQLIMHLRH